MAYKSILTILSDPRDVSRLDAAAELAMGQDGHLEVMCLGINFTQSSYYFPSAAPYILQETIDHAISEAEALKAAVNERLARYPDLRWSVEAAAVQSGGLGPLIGARARFADLAVLGRPYGEDRGDEAEQVVEAAMFEGGCPVLVLPDVELPPVPPRRVMIAWNQSQEAMVAIRRALPLLIAAESVEITIVDPRRAGSERSDPGGALAQMLIRHGVRAEIAVLARTEATISDELNRRATEIGADLIVMGAYGHSRFREAILGGATRNMLEKAIVPVLMAR